MKFVTLLKVTLSLTTLVSCKPVQPNGNDGAVGFVRRYWGYPMIWADTDEHNDSQSTTTTTDNNSNADTNSNQVVAGSNVKKSTSSNANANANNSNRNLNNRNLVNSNYNSNSDYDSDIIDDTSKVVNYRNNKKPSKYIGVPINVSDDENLS